MKYQITHSPTFSKLDLTLGAGESVIAQPSAMLVMTTGIEVTAKMGGQLKRDGRGTIRHAVKSLLSGEEAFAAIFTAKRDGEEISLAPEFIGEIFPLDLETGNFFVTQGSFLACDEKVNISIKYGGFKGLLAKKGMFLMHVKGPGTIFLSSYGAVIRRTLEREEKIVVDNRYVIAFSDTVSYDLVKAARKLSHSVMSGEGLVNRYTGPGEIIYQTRGKMKTGGFLRGVIEIAT